MFISENHKINPSETKIWLSSPTMHPESRVYMDEAFDTNWVSTVGRNIWECEVISAQKAEVNYAVALSSGTAALQENVFMENRISARALWRAGGFSAQI